MAKKINLKYAGKKLEILLIKTEEAPQLKEKPAIVAPGSGEIEIGQPQFMQESLIAGQPVSCTVEIKGNMIAQIYSEVFYQQNKTLIGPIQRDFVRCATEREVKGMLHPRWDETNQIDFSLTPRPVKLFCGENFTLAFLNPEKYGVSTEHQIWSLEGIYQRGGGEPFRARFEFDGNGDLSRKIGFYPASTTGAVAPFELFIEDGDTFEPYATVLSVKGEENVATLHPLLLTSGCGMRWQAGESLEGTYHIGVCVVDFDGKQTRRLAPLSLQF